MPPSRDVEGPPVDEIEKDFLDALVRLRNGEPTDKALKAKQRKGILKITISSVAAEAKRSRTLIGMDLCRYPRVRQLILHEKSGESAEPRTYSELTKRLRAQVRDLEIQVKQYKHEAGAHFIARHEAEKSLQQANSQIARLNKQLKEARKVIHINPNTNKHLPQLLLIRGLPGCGKSTRAMAYKSQGYRHLETDMFFMRDGEYLFDNDKLPEAHAWCLKEAKEALERGEHVVVSNVFATLEDIQPYTLLSTHYEVVEANWRGKSGHDIPGRTYRAMVKKWVSTELLLEQLNTSDANHPKVVEIGTGKGKN